MKQRLTCIAVAALLALSACSPSNPSSPTKDAANTSKAFPAKVMSCDEELSFTKAPERVVVMDDTDLSILNELGLLDKVVARSGKLRTAPYDEATVKKLEAIPTIKSTVLASGGTNLSTETVLAKTPDLVIGFDAGVDRDALRKAGIPLYAPISFCANLNPAKATFNLATEEITRVAKIFGVPDKGKQLTSKVAADVEQLTKAAPKGRGTAAAVYVMPDSKAFYVYGNSSMVQPIFEANGLTNVYGEDSKRVFDGSMEDLLKKNPDHIILLYGEGAADKALPTFLSFAGAEKMKAVSERKVVTMAFSLTDPPTPNSIKGAKVLADLLK